MRPALLVLPLLLLAAGARAAPPAAEAAAGQAIFDRTCRNCHSLEVGVNKVGPSLWHVVGRPSASVEGYEYSPAMRALRATWTPEALNVYLQNPRGDVHGAKMFFKGLADARDRANVIAYLQSVQ